ncbi:MAG TPA: DJ-1/PfpI family protein [Planctomycetaceae bacterium]|jgi:transcriptional regulator GlxA family with amidase domain|nr:DJ-1/PfpI family protein [Planctomycetaceae bacterium]
MRNVAILIFPEVEVLDFCGPFEAFSVTSEVSAPGAFNVFTVAEQPGPVHTRNGLSVNPHYRLDDAPQPHVLLIPGGLGTRPLLNNQPLLEWIRTKSKSAELTLSVCTGSLVLAKAGLLDGLGTTTHWGAIDLLRELAPKSTVYTDRRFVDNGHVICSAGIAAGIDMSLHVIERLLGPDATLKTARYMEYPWHAGAYEPAGGRRSC